MLLCLSSLVDTLIVANWLHNVNSDVYHFVWSTPVISLGSRDLHHACSRLTYAWFTSVRASTYSAIPRLITRCYELQAVRTKLICSFPVYFPSVPEGHLASGEGARGPRHSHRSGLNYYEFPPAILFYTIPLIVKLQPVWLFSFSLFWFWHWFFVLLCIR